MNERPCKWYYDSSVPGGRYLVPGCWNRVVHGDDAECQCEGVEEQADIENDLLLRLERLELEVDRMRAVKQPRASEEGWE